MIKEPFVLCQYCDDVRFETNNKITYVGVYNGQMIITGQLPVPVPKLVAAASILLPLDFEIQSLRFQLNWNGDVLQDVAIPEGETQRILVEASQRQDHPNIEKRGKLFQCALAMTPFLVNSPGVLRFDALLNGVDYRANSLIVEVAATQ